MAGQKVSLPDYQERFESTPSSKHNIQARTITINAKSPNGSFVEKLAKNTLFKPNPNYEESLFKTCQLYPDDNYLILVEKCPGDASQLNVIYSIYFKNIIEMELVNSTNKYTIGSTNTLQVSFVTSIDRFQRYILAKWAQLNQEDDDLEEDPKEYIQTIQLKFSGGEQQAIDFQHTFVENKRQILIGEQSSKLNAFLEEKCQAEIDFIQVNIES